VVVLFMTLGVTTLTLVDSQQKESLAAIPTASGTTKTASLRGRRNPASIVLARLRRP
jgi:hypothetical protein